MQETDSPKEFLDYFISNKLFELLLENLSRASEEESSENAQVTSDILSIFENFIEIYPLSSEIITKKTKLLNWMLKQLKTTEFSHNKLFISELLNALVGNSSDNQILMSKNEGFIQLVKIIYVS